MSFPLGGWTSKDVVYFTQTSYVTSDAKVYQVRGIDKLAK